MEAYMKIIQLNPDAVFDRMKLCSLIQKADAASMGKSWGEGGGGRGWGDDDDDFSLKFHLRKSTWE